jgi:hypothetical protein
MSLCVGDRFVCSSDLHTKNKIFYLSNFRKSVEIIQDWLKFDKISGSLHEDVCISMKFRA